MPEWHFKPQQPGDVIREPIHGEFFASDAVSDPGKSLVREGIQNALDAGSEKRCPVLVRIYLSSEKAVAADNFFDAAWAHFGASGNGLYQEELPSPNDQCKFVVFEDFSTEGLEGNPEEYRRPEGRDRKNRFYHFFRAEGQSDKDPSDSGRRGCWGVGKQVFFQASKIKTIFGLTVRQSDKHRLMMGKAILKTHYVAGEGYQDGYWGIRSDKDKHENFVLPVDDPAVLNRFTKLFGLQREPYDPGLSLVVPWPDTQITDRAIVDAVLRDYFYPILSGHLEVIVETPSVETSLDKNTLPKEVERLDNEICLDIKPLTELTGWFLGLNDEEFITATEQNCERACRWDLSLFTDAQLKTLREAYHKGTKLAVRVPVNVRKKDNEIKPSFFDISLVRDNMDQSGSPTFIREDIIISEVKAPRTRGVRSIVVARDAPLAEFLRDAENPSHTQWNHSRLKEKYKYGYKTDLEFVTRSVYELVQILTKDEHEEDPILLEDFFSIPAPRIEDPPPDPPVDPPGPPPVDLPPPISQPFRISINNAAGGFSVLPANKALQPPDCLKVSVAYDVRRGNPLRKYNRADFRLQEKPIAFDPDPQNAEIVEKTDNTFVINIKDPDFKVSVIGFDKRRQLYVQVEPHKRLSDDD